MKRIAILPLLTALSLQGWPSYMALLYNPKVNHTVALLGEIHSIPSTVSYEHEFIDTLRPYLNTLLTNQLPLHSFILESNHTTAQDNAQKGLRSGLVHLSLLFLLTTLTLSSDSLASISESVLQQLQNTIKNYLSIDPLAPLNIMSADNRKEGLRALILLSENLKDLANTLFSQFKQAFPDLSYENINNGIEWLNKLFFDETFYQYLLSQNVSAHAIQLWQQSFRISFHKIFTKMGISPETSLNQVESLIQEHIDFITSLNIFLKENIPSSSRPLIFLQIEKELRFIKNQLNILRLYSLGDPSLISNVLDLVFRAKNFYALVNTFNFSKILGHQNPLLSSASIDLINLHHANFLLMTYFADLGFLKAILGEAGKNKNCFVFTGAGHSTILTQLLTALDYEIILKVDNISPYIPISNTQLHQFITRYIQLCNQKANQSGH